MPPEYSLWVEQLGIRDQAALILGSGGVLFALSMLFAFEWFRRPDADRASAVGHNRFTLFTRWSQLGRDRQLLIILGAGLGLRLFNLDTNALWHDESLSALTTLVSPADIWQVSAHSAHPPLYYLLLWAWCWPLNHYFGVVPPEWWIRLPSVLLGTANLLLFYRLGVAVSNIRFDDCLPSATGEARSYEPEVVLAMALMAALPFHIYYSQEARMYELALFGIMWALWGVLDLRVKLLEIGVPQRTTRRYVGLIPIVVGTTLALYSQVVVGVIGFGLVGLLAIVVGLYDLKHNVYHFRDWEGYLGPVWRTGAALAVVVLLYLPWLTSGLMVQTDRIGKGNGFWVPDVTLGNGVYTLHSMYWSDVLYNNILMSIPGFFITAFVLTVGIWWALVQKRWLVLMLFLAPLAAGVLMSVTYRSVWLPRTMIAATPGMLLLTALAMRRSKWLVTPMLVGLLLVGWFTYYNNELKLSSTTWSEHIEERWQDGDGILFISRVLVMEWYLPSTSPTYYLRVDPTDPLYGMMMTNGALEALGLEFVDVVDGVPDVPHEHDRLFLIFTYSIATPMELRPIFNFYEENWREVDRLEFVKDGDMLTGVILLVERPTEKAYRHRNSLQE